MRIISADKGMAPTTLLMIVIAIIVGFFAILFIDNQTHFLTGIAEYLANLMSIKL